MRKFKRLTLTLALLLTAVGGAWAEETPLLTIESKDYTSFKSGSMTFDDKVTVTFSEEVSNDGAPDGWYTVSPASQLTVAGINGYTITSCKFYTKSGDANTGYTVEGESPSVLLFAFAVYTNDSEQEKIGSPGVKKIEVYGSKSEPTEWSLTPDETGKTWTLAKMPASNVELQVEYFAESNLFLSKDALADKANIAVTAGELGVQFGDDGKSANTITEGTPMTVTYTGAKKVIGVKVEKKAPATPLDNTTTAWTAGTFAVPAGGLTYSDAITVSGDVTLTLTDGETLTLNKGISLASGATLTVKGNGTMVVNGTSGSTASTVAGSTGTLILTSGTLTATGGKGEDKTDSQQTGASGGAAINGSVTVNGGSLTANGGNGGNCIGKAMDFTNGGAGGAAISGDVTITDGAVAATGGNGGNIQDSRSGYSIHGGAGGAAIGGNATLTGGTLTTKQGANGTETGRLTNSSVGTGGKAVAGTVTNNGGTVNQ